MKILSVTWNCGDNYINHLHGDSEQSDTLINISLSQYFQELMTKITESGYSLPEIIFISLQELPKDVKYNDLITNFGTEGGDNAVIDGYNIKYVYTKNPPYKACGASGENFKLAIIVMVKNGHEVSGDTQIPQEVLMSEQSSMGKNLSRNLSRKLSSSLSSLSRTLTPQRKSSRHLIVEDVGTIEGGQSRMFPKNRKGNKSNKQRKKSNKQRKKSNKQRKSKRLSKNLNKRRNTFKTKRNNKIIKKQSYKGGDLYSRNPDITCGTISLGLSKANMCKGCIYLYDSDDNILYATVHLPFGDNTINKLGDNLLTIIDKLVNKGILNNDTKIIIAGDFNSRILLTSLCSKKNNQAIIDATDGSSLKTVLDNINRLVNERDTRPYASGPLLNCNEMYTDSEHVNRCSANELSGDPDAVSDPTTQFLPTDERETLIKFLANLDYLPKSIQLATGKAENNLEREGERGLGARSARARSRAMSKIELNQKIFNILNNMMLPNTNNRYGLPVSYKFSSEDDPETVNGTKYFSDRKNGEPPQGRDPSIGDITVVSSNSEVSGLQVSRMVGNDHATVATYMDFS